MKAVIPTHDDFIRRIFSDKKLAIEYFKSFLPAYITVLIDFSSLKQESASYLSDELKKTLSDIVYSCKLKGGESYIKICFLLEHKSHPDKYSTIQIGSYLFSAWQNQIRNNEPLSMIIPILLYHGKEKWEYNKLTDLFKDLNPELKKFLPDFEYVYNNLGALTDRQIENLNNKFLVASFLALKHSMDKKWISANAGKLIILASNEDKGLTKAFIVYLYSRGRIEEKVLNSLPKPLKEKVMNTLEIYIEKGMKKGMEKGMEKGILKGREKGIQERNSDFVRNLLLNTDFSIKKIAELVSVSESFVRKVKAEISK